MKTTCKTFSPMLVWVCVVGIVFLVASAGCGPKPPPISNEKPVVTQTGARPVPAATAAWEEKWGKILRAAKEEGSARIYTSQPPDVTVGLAKEFKERYGIDLEFVSGRPTELAQKVLTERRAGLYLADVFISGATFLVILLKPNDVIEPIEAALILPEVADPKMWRDGHLPFFDKDRTSIGFAAALSRHILRNTDMVGPDEISSYRDLLKPKWKGKIVLDDPSTGGSGLSWVTMLAENIWGLEETRSYLRELKKQDVGVISDARLQVEWVARGKYPVSIASRVETVFDFLGAGAPIALMKAAEGSMMLSGGNGIGLASKAAHPNAAVVFVNWLLGKEGQINMGKTTGRPSLRLDVPKEGFHPSAFPDPGEKTYLADENFYLANAKVLAMFKEVFAP